MRIASKPALLTVPVVMFITLVAVLALWATGNIGGNGIGGTSSSAGITWNVEYWHRNADGDLLQHKKAHNTVTDEGKQAAMERLINASVVVTDTSGGVMTEANAFDQIVLLDTERLASFINGGTTGVIVQGDILADVGGQAGNTAPAVSGTWNNPTDSTYAPVGTDGEGTATASFVGEDNGTNTAGPGPALAMLLGRFPVDQNDDDLGLAIDEDDILAAIAISVDLAQADTLTITWTIDIN